MIRLTKLSNATLLACLAATMVYTAACSSDSEPGPLTSSHSYKGHASDVDANNFVTVYRAALGTRLDDCQTCHTGGTFTVGSGTGVKSYTKNPCDFCHLINHPAADFNEAQPLTFAETLNPFGAAYLAAGRTPAALEAIAGDDSDGDGFANQDEIDALKYPGDASSKPGQPTAPMKVFTRADLQALTAHEEFLLANSNKQQYDDYSTYKGVKLTDLLLAAGVDPTSPEITGVTISAPDGYLKDVPVESFSQAYPAGLYYAGLDTTTLGTECGFVTYPDTLPEGLTDGGEIPGEQWVLLAYERDGLPMDPSNLDPTSGKINGEGPFRLVVPQAVPGMPDRGSQYSPTTCNDGHDYDAAATHNAGDMVRGVVGVRINPLPEGYEDFDYRNGGWAYIDSASVIVYGHGITE
jgi:hypothetical protein